MKTKKSIAGKILIYFFLILLALLFLVPVFYVMYNSLLPKRYIGSFVSPALWSLDNYKELFSEYPIMKWYGNTAISTVAVVLGNIFFTPLAGYGLARLRFPGKKVIFICLMLSMMIPGQLVFIYYGLPKIGIRTDAAVCGIAGLAFLGGSYMAEAFRSGLESIEPIQTESAYSLGMDRMQTMRYVILPQAMSTSVPAFVANVIFLLKETSVFSAISLMDLMFTAKDLIGLYYKTTESLFLLVVFYLLILLPVSLLGSLLERRLRYAGFGA